MTSLFPVSAPRAVLRRGFFVLATVGLLSSAVAQTDPNANGNDRRAQRRAAQAQNADQTPNADANGGGFGRGRGQNFDPAQMQQQMMDRMREQLGVTDDGEWKLISDRITAVMELRRNAQAGGGGFGGRGGQNFQGGQPGGGQGGQGGRRGGNFTASPETTALRQAIEDKLPDAEIKARLARVREVKKTNDEKLAKAQDDLRALLTVRQEAMAVLAGYLP
jgi:hypothetical protein